MTEPRCSLCGKGVFSGAILTSVTDRSGARSMACRAWCGPTPAPVMSVERLEQVRKAATTDLERELLAEIDIAFRCVRRAEMDGYKAAADDSPYAPGSMHGGKDGSNWVVVGRLTDGSPVLCDYTSTVDGRPDRGVELQTLRDVQAWPGLDDKTGEVAS